MADKPKHWIADPEGVRAPVESAEVRDHLVSVNGWTESTEPDRQDFVWLRHEDPALGETRMTWEAAQLDAWAGRGWTPGLLADRPEPKPSAKTPATSGDKPDKS